jgi:hypothetical protein
VLAIAIELLIIAAVTIWRVLVLVRVPTLLLIGGRQKGKRRKKKQKGTCTDFSVAPCLT